MRLIFTLCAVFFTASELLGTSLRLPLYSDISSLDPRVGSESTNNIFIGNIYESLFKYDSEGNIVPALCEKWEVSENGLTYTFYLRDSMWSDGSPCTAHDFEYAWKKCCNPKYAERATYFMYPIKNAERCLNKECDVEEVGIRALSQKKLQIDLEFPTEYLFEACASTSNYKPICKKMDEDHPDWVRNWKIHLVTNGPFKIKDWKADYEIVLEKNPKYWDQSSIKLDGIHFSIIPDHNTAFMMFEKGKLDWVGDPLGMIQNEAVHPSKFNELFRKEMNATDILCANVLKFPFSNKNFRKAVSIVLNRKEIADSIFYLGNKKPTTSFINGSVSLNPCGYFKDSDIQLAKELFQEALLETGNSPKDFSFVYSHRSGAPPIGEIIQETLRGVFGISVELIQKDWNIHFSDLRNGDYQLGEVAWTSYVPDPFFYLSFYLEANTPLNLSNWGSEIFRYLFNRGRYCNDPDRKKMYYQLAEEHMIDEMPIIPLFQKIALYKTNPKLKGYYFSPGFYLDLKNAYFNE